MKGKNYKDPRFKIAKFLDDKKKRDEYNQELRKKRDAEEKGKTFKEFRESYSASKPRFTGNRIPKNLLDALPKVWRSAVNGFDHTDKGIIVSFDKKLSPRTIKEIEKSLGDEFRQNGYDNVEDYHMYHFKDYSQD